MQAESTTNKQFTINTVNEYLAGKITFKSLETRLKREKVQLKAFIRGKAQIKGHFLIENKSEIICF